MRRPGEAVELHQGPVQRQLPGRRLPDSAREVPPGPPSRPAASCPPGSAPDSLLPRGGGRLQPGDAHLFEGSPSSRLAHPPSLPGDFGASRHELAVRGLGPRGREGQSPLPHPTPTTPSEGAWHPAAPGPSPTSPRVEEGDRERGGAGAALAGLFRERRVREVATHETKETAPTVLRERAGPSL